MFKRRIILIVTIYIIMMIVIFAYIKNAEVSIPTSVSVESTDKFIAPKIESDQIPKESTKEATPALNPETKTITDGERHFEIVEGLESFPERKLKRKKKKALKADIVNAEIDTSPANIKAEESAIPRPLSIEIKPGKHDIKNETRVDAIYNRIDPIVLVKTRDFLYSNSSPLLPVYGMVIFTSKPVTDEQKNKYKLICELWEASLILSSEIIEEVNTDKFTTYWPTLMDNKESHSSCDYLHNYDYVTAQKAITKLDISKPGPMLLAVYESNNEVKHIMLNLDLLSDKDIIRAFNIWKFDLVVTKNGWNKSFTITYFKEKFKNLLDTYGHALLEFKEKG